MQDANSVCKSWMCKARRPASLPWRTFASVVILASFSSGAGGAPAGERQRVLLVYSEDRLLPATLISDEALRATLEGGSANQIELYSEFLDTGRFPGEAHQQRLAAYFREKYAERPPHLLIAGGGDALSFLLKQRATLFTGVPIVYGAVRADELPGELPNEVVGVPLVRRASSTLETALRLQPDTRHVAVVAGSAASDRERVEELSRETPAFSSRVSFTWLTGLSMPALRAALSGLPDHTIVFYLTMFQDADGKRFAPRQALEEFAPASRAPIYGYYDSYLGHGIVGGSMVTFEELGRTAAKVGLRILAGEDPRTVVSSAANRETPMFDAKQLVRWKIPEARLPPASVLRFKEPAVWEAHRTVVITASVAFLVQVGLIVALLLERRLRRRTAAALEESKERMTLAARAAELSMWVWDVSGDRLWQAGSSRRTANPPIEQAVGLRQALETVHPEDRGAVERAVHQSVTNDQDLDVEFRLVRPDGEVRWVAARGRPEKGGGQHLFGVTLDVTDRKLAELQAERDRTALRHMMRVSLLGQLSASIAHQMNQPLAAILGNAEALQKILGRQPIDLAELRSICDDIVAEDVRAAEVIRHLRTLFRRRSQLQLEPVDVNELVLETLNLVRAELSARHVTIVTDLAPSLPTVDADRVQMQQVLMNFIFNASDAMSGIDGRDGMVTVRTEASDTDTRILVADNGPGIRPEDLAKVFEPFWSTKPEGMGMGLAICQTIVAAHGGDLTVSNNPDVGATFRVTLPARRNA